MSYKGSRHRVGDYTAYQNNFDAVFRARVKCGMKVRITATTSGFHSALGEIVRRNPLPEDAFAPRWFVKTDGYDEVSFDESEFEVTP